MTDPLSNCKRPVKIFYSYAHADEPFRNKLQQHLALLKRDGLVTEWHDRKILPGEHWGTQIHSHLDSADIVLLLISPDFMSSDYCYDVEVRRSFERHQVGAVRVIPVILRPCDWEGAIFGQLQALPKDATPVTLWDNEDVAFLDIAQGIRSSIDGLDSDIGSCPSAPPVLGKHIPREITPRIIDSLKTVSRGMQLVHGPSGFGKSTLASQVFNEWERTKRDWFDCERPISPRQAAFDGSLLVIENLDHVYKAESAHSVNSSRIQSIMPWINDSHASILVLTRKQEVAERFLSDLGRRNDPKAQVVSLGQGFSSTECCEFLGRTVSPDELSEHMGLALNQYIKGCPFIWQLLLELIHRNTLQEIFISDPNGLDQTKVRKQIYEVWFREIRVSNRLAIKASQVLCRVSLYAMDTAAIAHLLGNSEEEVNLALEPLIDSGFIRRACLGDCSWYPHAMYREACRSVPDSEIVERTLRPRYRDYLRVALNDPEDTKFNFLTKIDAWIVGVQQAFSVVARRDILPRDIENNFAGFFDQYRELSTDLTRIFERGRASGMQFSWLVEAFRTQIEAMDCRELIGVAQVMSLVPTRNKAIAEIMWLALSPSAKVSWFSEESDSWARAESIHTAAIHWTKQGEEIRTEGINRLLSRLTQCLDQPDLKHYERTHELNAIFGGLCLLEYRDEAIELLHSSLIYLRYPDVCVMMLLFFLDNCPRPEANRLLADLWHGVPEGELRGLFEMYLVSKGISTPVSQRDEVLVNPTYISLVGRMAHAPQFGNFFGEVVRGSNLQWTNQEKTLCRLTFSPLLKQRFWGQN